MRRLWTCLAFLLAFAAALSRARAADFYAGKRLTILVNYDAGGPTDIEARLLAKFIARHIPGSPTIIVQNMAGASGLTGARFIGEIAPRDGTMAGYLMASSHRAAFQPERFGVDFKTYEFIAYAPNGRIHFMRADVEPGMHAPADLLKAKGLVAGGLGAESVKDIAMRLLLDMLGLQYKYVTGYNSSARGALALQRGEINYFSDSPSMYLSRLAPTLVKSGELLPVFTEPEYDGKTFKLPKQLQGIPVPTFADFYTSAKGAPPSGKLWDSYLALQAVSSSYYRLFVMPPGTPPEATAALKAAVVELNADKDYQDEAQRAINEPLEYGTSPTLNDDIRSVLTVTPELRAFMADYVKRGG